MSNREKVREYFQEMKIGTAATAAKALGIPQKTASAHVRDLFEQGWLTKRPGCFGMYDYHQLKEHEHGKAVKLQEKMWRAMRQSKRFTVWDIALYSGASIEYVRDFVKHLIGKNLIRRAGKTGQRPIYITQDDVREATPVMRTGASVKETARQELIALGWALMQALRDGDMKKAGHTLDARGGDKPMMEKFKETMAITGEAIRGCFIATVGIIVDGVGWIAAVLTQKQMEIERIIFIVLLVSMLLFGIADWFGLFGAGCTCRYPVIYE